MRILFYLPVVTEWWFEHAIGFLIRAAAREAEVHVIVPPPWSLTGITPAQLARCADLADVRWHIIDGPDHPSYRTASESPQGLIDFVRQIDPDYTFCRSADVVTPGHFPGKVRYLMEADFPPLPPRQLPHYERMMLTGPELYDHGFMPTLDPAERAWLDARIAPVWDMLQARHACDGNRQAYLLEAGLPADRKIIALPLDYNGADNFFSRVHSVEPADDRFVAAMAGALDDGFVLAVTIHPIDEQYPSEMVDRIAAMDPDKVRIVRSRSTGHGNATMTLVRHSDGMIVRDSKSFSNAAFFGKPILRRSRFATAGWLDAYTDVSEFREAVRAGAARTVDPGEMRTWFAYQYANNAFTAIDPDMSLAQLVDRTDRPFDPTRWEANLARAVARHRPEAAEPPAAA